MNIIPSYQQGFANYAGESQAPQHWKGLVGGWFPSLGPTGSTLRDLSRKNGNGSIFNMEAVDWGIGGNERMPGYTLDFDGNNEYVNLGQVSGIDNLSNFSIACWVKLDVVDTDQAIYWKGINSFNNEGAIALFFDDVESTSSNTDTFNFIFRENTDFYRAFTASGGVVANQWYHVVGVASLGNANKIYVNGVDATAGSVGTWTGTLPSLTIASIIS